MPHMLRWCSIVCALLGAPAVAQAQASFPDRPIRLVVAFPPGGATDTLARQITQQSAPMLSFSHRNYRSILDGTKTQTTRRRLDPQIEAGRIVGASVTRFADLEIEEVRRCRLREIGEDDARQEGAPSLAEFREQWKRQYGGWDDDETVYLVRFKVVRTL